MAQVMAAFSARDEWKKHWTVVVAGAAGTFATSITAYVIGVFLNPLQEEFGWSRAGISAALTVYSTMGFFGSIAAGYLLDRVGARLMGLLGVLTFSLAFGSLAFITSNIWTWWGIWVIIGITGLGMKPVVWAKAVTSFFYKGRGLAIALMLCGTAAGSTLLPIATNAMITRYDWRFAFAGLGLGVGLIVVPILYFFLYDSTDNSNECEKKTDPSTLPGWTAREGMCRRQLYQISFSCFATVGVILGFSFHMVAMLTEQGIPRSTAVPLLSLVGFSSVVGRISIGHIFDRFQHPAIGAISLGLPAIPALILLFVPPSLSSAIAAVVALGLCAGGEFDAVIYLSSRFFGLRAFGVLFGVVETAMFGGIALGPIMAGAIFDATGSYQAFYYIAAPLCLLSAALTFLLGPFPKHSDPANAPDQIAVPPSGT